MNFELFYAIQNAAAPAEDSGWLDIPAPWLALAGTVVGTIGLKLVESWLNNPAKKDSTPAELREELRKQIEGLKTDVARQTEIINETEDDMQEWQAKYWALVEEHSKIQHQMRGYLLELQKLREDIQENHVSRDEQ